MGRTMEDSGGLVENGFGAGFVIEIQFGKDNPKGSIASGSAVHLDECLVGLEDLVGDRETEAHAFTDVLGSEKWIENLGQVFGWNANAIVADSDLPGIAGWLHCDVQTSGFAAIGFDALLDGVDAVLEEIDEHLDELVRVAADQDMVRCCEIESDVLADLMADHAPRARDDFREIRVAGGGFVLAGELAEVDDDLRDSLDSFTNVLEDIREIRLIFGGKDLGERFESVDASARIVEGVVDFVDDARAHAAEGREFFIPDHQDFVYLDLFEGGLEFRVEIDHFPADAGHGDLIFKSQSEFSGGEGFG